MVFAPESASAVAEASVADAFDDFDFFELVFFAPESASAEAVESAEDALDFFELVFFVPESASADAVEPEAEAFDDFDFFELAVSADPLDDFESLSAAAAFVFLDFDVDVFAEDASDDESVELASADFFFDLLVFFAVAVLLASLESVDCALAAGAIARPIPRPVQTSKTNRYFSNRFIVNPPQSRCGYLCVVPGNLAA